MSETQSGLSLAGHCSLYFYLYAVLMFVAVVQQQSF